MDNWMVQPVVQYGFLGFSAVLLGVVIWLIRRLLGVLEANNEVLKANSAIIAANTEASRQLMNMTAELLKLSRGMHERLLALLTRLNKHYVPGEAT